jgi:hypothetical protein
MDGRAPWLQVQTKARLTLRDLTIRVEPTPGARIPSPPTVPLIEATGNIRFERCTFIVQGQSPALSAISCGGSLAEFFGCVFVGFDRAAYFQAYPDSSRVFRNCLFIRDPNSTIPHRWAITIRPVRTPAKAKAPAPGPRLTSIDRCTVVGEGLLAFETVAADALLDCRVTNSAVRSAALVGWAGSITDLDASLAWKGQNNIYDLFSPSWVIWPTPAPGPISLADPPADLASFAKKPRTEEKSRASMLNFVGRDPGEKNPWSDFALMQDPGSPVGIDPKEIGAPAPPNLTP